MSTLFVLLFFIWGPKTEAETQRDTRLINWEFRRTFGKLINLVSLCVSVCFSVCVCGNLDELTLEFIYLFRLSKSSTNNNNLSLSLSIVYYEQQQWRTQHTNSKQQEQHTATTTSHNDNNPRQQQPRMLLAKKGNSRHLSTRRASKRGLKLKPCEAATRYLYLCLCILFLCVRCVCVCCASIGCYSKIPGTYTQ